MGVPKFFRYISERYPCLSESIKEYQIPEFDHLYLDMNGIIHMCSHPDDGNPHFRITEERIFSDVFHYIEVLFQMIKPQKLFFMAVDGVAPRAKMNQQRGRRFRSAKDADKAEAAALKKGEQLPTEARFDSNCITPGTPFMVRLQEQLKYFVVSKISTDKLWKRCTVILSGHETPGEGEHKIMDYIRYMRSQPGYDPNTRHCLYGLDADLIMLGLCSHDPHFSLLREEVKFGKKTNNNSKRNSVPEDIKFYLLHLSLMREYLELEFALLKNKLTTFEYDMEKIIDDWVLMGFLVGNDFIPHLPNLHIQNGALAILYKAYIDILPTLDGYINEGGILNLVRFEKFMIKLSDLDKDNFEEAQEDLAYIEAKTGRKYNPFSKNNPVKNTGRKLEEWKSDGDSTTFEEESLEPQRKRDDGLQALIQATNDMYLGTSDEDDSSDSDDAFKCYKKAYYMNKLSYSKVNAAVMRDQAEGYVRAIQWNLHYYYNGVASWSWYYPHHYAPYISDIKGFANLKLEYDLGTPFKPYEQLLAVLPSASKDLLPKSYHHLMTSENSLIKDYYPEDFQTDLNGKKQDWEAVVLIPFIDENVLLEAMEPCNQLLTEEEVQRNTHGPMLVYNYSNENLGSYESPMYFPDVIENHANLVLLSIVDIRVPIEKLVKGAYPGVLLDVYYPGFPTMKHLKYEGYLKKERVAVFDQPSRNENMIVKIISPKIDKDDNAADDEIPADLLGKTVFVGWPHMVEAKVVSITNSKDRFVSMGDEEGQYNVEPCPATFRQEIHTVTNFYKTRMGIEFGEVKVLVKVQVMTGRRYIFTSMGRVSLEKNFSKETANYPLQAVLKDIKVYDSAVAHTTFNDVEQVFPIGCYCFTLSLPLYGAQGTVKGYVETEQGKRIKISVPDASEPNLNSLKAIEEQLRGKYQTVYSCASQCDMSSYMVSRITGSIFIPIKNNEGGFKNVNIGLDLKFNKKNMEIPGYSKKFDGVWLFSEKVVDMLCEYTDKFPEVFRYLSNSSGNNDDIRIEDVFPEDVDERLKACIDWLKSLPYRSVEKKSCGSVILESDTVTALEKIVDNFKQQKSKQITMQVKPNALYRPEVALGNLAPDSLADMRLLDRIVNVREGFTVPFGLKGTIIAIHEEENSKEQLYDIVFDSTFTGGMTLNCSANRGYRLNKTAIINLSYGERLKQKKSSNSADKQIGGFNKFSSNNGHYNNAVNNSPNQKSGYNRDYENSAFAFYGYGNRHMPPPQHANRQPHNSFANQAYSQQSNFNYPPQQQSQQKLFKNSPPSNANRPSKSHDQQQVVSKTNLDTFFNSAPISWRNRDGDDAQTKTPSVAPGKRADFMPKFSGENGGSNLQRTSEDSDNALKRLLKIGIDDKCTKVDETSKELNGNKTVAQNQKIPTNISLALRPESAHSSRRTQDETKAKNPFPFIKFVKPSTEEREVVNKEERVISHKNLPRDDRAPKKKHSTSVVALLSYYQSKGLGLPRYEYFQSSDQVQATITLPSRQVVVSTQCPTREEASESVASKALVELNSKISKNTDSTPSTMPSGNLPEPPKQWVGTPKFKKNESEAPNKQRGNEFKNKERNLDIGRNSHVHHSDRQRKISVENAFVPLQAMKQNRLSNSSKSNNNPIDPTDFSQLLPPKNTAEGSTSQGNSKDKVKIATYPKKAASRKERKSRIAANFNVKP